MADQYPIASSSGSGGSAKPEKEAFGGSGYVAVSNAQLERLTRSFECSARRWELIVYPTLFAFIVLAAYGFYLVYSLANDVAFMSRSIDRNMTDLVSSLEIISKDMDHMTFAVSDMSRNMQDISSQVRLLETMSEDMRQMQVSVRDMSYSTRFMQGDMRLMNHTFGRPMAAMSSPVSFARTFMPFR